LIEAHGGRLPRPTLRILSIHPSRLEWAVAALGVPSPCTGIEQAEVIGVAAAGEGSLGTLQWLRGLVDLSKFRLGAVYREAARAGHVHVLQWVRTELALPWDGSVCANAASAGQLHVLQWLREHGCPWDKMTTAWAELNGHVTVTKWALEHGCDHSSQLVLRLRMARVMAAR